jgi:hypothetical protein
MSTAKGAIQDQLRVCVDALSLLARQAQVNLNRPLVAEQTIKKYLQAAGANPTLALERLRTEIDKEIELSRAERNTRQRQFWITVQEYVCSRLPGN